MNKLLINTAALTATALISLSANAAVEANIGATSNYLWRGVTQTNDAAAVQGGIDYSHDAGFYAGTWASNVDFGNETSYEIDFYAGYGGSIGDDFGYDINYLYYAYPDAADDVDFGEITAALSWKWFDVSYSHVVNAGDDVTGDATLDEKDMGYLQASVTYPISDSLSVAAHYGVSSGDVVTAWYGTDDYADYSVSLSKDTDFGTVSFTVSDTDLEDDDAKVLVGYSYSFGL
ncbi:TorF family putative porin [Shewanella youngdeokensis]|uniref:TorF family putative porin n=1 Tax=Shewanella youngdeokensis TaxID=2999068 RepID=A0ABZ0JY35_9GAMM|nr:TorF family putative porin [Shewanella sp. DAU334]